MTAPADLSKLGERLRSQPRGAELLRQVLALGGCNKVLLSFSRGKDSIAAAIMLQDHGVELVPFFADRLLGISFIEESLAYYEEHLFGRKIIRCMHPSTAKQLKDYLHQPPHRIPVLEAASLVDNFDYIDLQQWVALREGLPDTVMTATGLRAADSVLRRTNFAKSGPINRTKQTFAPIWDWNKQQVLDAIDRRGLKLPADYQLFNRTFDGLMGEFLVPLKQHCPEDWAKVLEVFPLAEAEVRRYELIHGRAA